MPDELFYITDQFKKAGISPAGIVFNETTETYTVQDGSRMWVCEVGSDDDAWVFTLVTDTRIRLTIDFPPEGDI
jgi:hypothetical protein